MIYYRLCVEPKDPTRIRCQYMHILRRVRKELLEVADDLEDSKTKELLTGLANIIPVKVKSNECFDIINKLNERLIWEDSKEKKEKKEED